MALAPWGVLPNQKARPMTTDQDTPTTADKPLAQIRTEARRWDASVDSLLEAFQPASAEPEEISAPVAVRLEELRHKRDALMNKVAALGLHPAGEAGARHPARTWLEFKNARRELRQAWRTTVAAMDRESLFV